MGAAIFEAIVELFTGIWDPFERLIPRIWNRYWHRSLPFKAWALFLVSLVVIGAVLACVLSIAIVAVLVILLGRALL